MTVPCHRSVQSSRFVFALFGGTVLAAGCSLPLTIGGLALDGGADGVVPSDVGVSLSTPDALADVSLPMDSPGDTIDLTVLDVPTDAPTDNPPVCTDGSTAS